MTVSRKQFLVFMGGGAVSALSAALVTGKHPSDRAFGVKNTTTTGDGSTTSSTQKGTTTTTTSPLLCDIPTVTVTGPQPGGFTVPAGETWRVLGPVVCGGNVLVHGRLCMRPGDELWFDGDPAAYVGGGMDPIASDVGLWVMGDGILDVVGTPRTGWARDAKPADWQAGDEAVIAPSALGSGFTSSTAGAVTLPQGGIQKHDGSWLYTEVANLTRDVVIGALPGRAGHVFIRSTQPSIIDYVRLDGLGVTKPVLGRYPLHIHMSGDGSRGMHVRGAVAVGSKHHAFVPHLSNGITFTDCVAYDTVEEAFWWDVPDLSHDIAWLGCAALHVAPTAGQANQRLTGFLIGGGDGNRCEDCVAVGIGGTKFQSGYGWPEQVASVWVFARNVTHHARCGTFSWQNDGQAHTIDDHVNYRCDVGFFEGAYFNRYHMTRGQSLDCTTGAQSLALTQLQAGDVQDWIDCVFDGRGRSGAVGFLAGEHANPAPVQPDTVFVTRPIFAGNTTDFLVSSQTDPTDGPHHYEITVPTWGAPAGSRLVWAGAALPGAQVVIDGATYLPGQGL